MGEFKKPPSPNKTRGFSMSNVGGDKIVNGLVGSGGPREIPTTFKMG